MSTEAPHPACDVKFAALAPRLLQELSFDSAPQSLRSAQDEELSAPLLQKAERQVSLERILNFRTVCGSAFRGAHASRCRELSQNALTRSHARFGPMREGKFVLAGRQNQPARRVRSPELRIAHFSLQKSPKIPFDTRRAFVKFTARF